MFVLCVCFYVCAYVFVYLCMCVKVYGVIIFISMYQSFITYLFLSNGRRFGFIIKYVNLLTFIDYECLFIVIIIFNKRVYLFYEIEVNIYFMYVVYFFFIF